MIRLLIHWGLCICVTNIRRTGCNYEDVSFIHVDDYELINSFVDKSAFPDRSGAVSDEKASVFSFAYETDQSYFECT